MKSSLFGALLAASSFVAATAAQGAVLVSDNFTNSTGSAVNTVSNTEAVGTGAVTRIFDGSSTMSVTTRTELPTGNVLGMSNGTSAFFREFNGASTLTLNGLAAGETLSLSFDISFSVSPTLAENFNFGFINATTPYSILYTTLDLNGTTPNPQNGTSEFRFRNTASNAALMSENGTAVGTTFGTLPYAAATKYTMGIDVTKLNAAGDLQVRFLQDGSVVTAQTFLASSTLVTTVGNQPISGIGFRQSNTPGATTFIDNVVVETTTAVPEPTSLGLLLGAGLLALRRRK